MKKNVLALSIAAMIGGLGFASTAAPDVIRAAPNFGRVSLGTTRVRFRGSHADDLRDFEIFLSPGDLWTTAVMPYYRATQPSVLLPYCTGGQP